MSADVAIVGGGMVGAALAVRLADDGFRVAVIEVTVPRTPDPDQTGIRVSAISRASERLLIRTGAWNELAEHACPFTAMRVWDGVGDGTLRFGADELGEPDLGHIIENDRIVHALWARLRDHENVTLHCPDSVDSLQVDDDVARLELSSGTHLDARLVVGADGGNSRIRELAGIRTVGWSYGQKTIVGNLRTARDHEHTCWQRFTPSGPVAFLPLRDGRCSLAWHTTTRHADHLLTLSDEAFRTELAVASGRVLGEIVELGPHGAFPLSLRHAIHYARPRIALVGDAAHTVHPLAGQGVNLGLLDAGALADTLVTGRDAGEGPGDLQRLRRYQRRRQAENTAMQLGLDAFKRGFGSSLAPVRWARNLGLNLADRGGPAKRAMMRHALGLGGKR